MTSKEQNSKMASEGGNVANECNLQDLCGDLSLFFFFQAEDGIRDLTVTGVQTCALPISFREYRNSRRGSGQAHAFEHAQGAASPGGPRAARTRFRYGETTLAEGHLRCPDRKSVV